MKSHRIALIFPFYEKSSNELNSILRMIISENANIIVVDDNANPPYKRGNLPVKVLRNEKNNGKGSAIIKAVLDIRQNNSEKIEAILTADSDGQHCAEDILQAIRLWNEESDYKVIISGARDFSDPSVPLFSKIGNFLSSLLIYIETGKNFPDTQNGLRIYPLSLFEEIDVCSERFGFETETLVKALRNGYKIKFFPIKTIYPQNRKSHFRIIMDTLRISILHISLLFTKK